jgi:hypothetical protein
MFKKSKIICGLSLLLILIGSLGIVFAPNAVMALKPVYNNDNTEIVSITYIIHGPGGDPDAHVNVNTRELNANITITNLDSGIDIFNINNIPVNWAQNWSGPSGSYPTPNCVLMTGNTADNGTVFHISKSEFKPGHYKIFMPFTYYEIVPGKPDRVVENFIDPDQNNPDNFNIFSSPTNTTITLNNINDIYVGDYATITGTLTQDFDNASLGGKYINISISDKNFSPRTDENGFFNINVNNLNIGDYNITAIYNGDGEYNTTTRTGGVYLPSKIAMKNFSVNKRPLFPGDNSTNITNNTNINPIYPVYRNINPIEPVYSNLDKTGYTLILLLILILLVVSIGGENR